MKVLNEDLLSYAQIFDNRGRVKNTFRRSYRWNSTTKC